MAESCVLEIELRNPEVNTFIREVESKHGDILTLSELYARDQKLGNEIVLGVVDDVSRVIEKPDRQLLVVRMCEVTIKCHRGQVFSVYAFNKFATTLADAHLQKGDFAAFRSACIRESSQYRTEKGCHHLEAHIGIPEQPSAKIFFARKPHITNAGTSKQHSPTNCESSSVAPSNISRAPKYTYKRLSELVEPEKKINIYGVIHSIVKLPREDDKHAIVRLKDETCGPDQEFLVHIFFRRETAFPKLEYGYILRLHRLKTELFDGVLDGRVFHATDVMTFPPDGRGIADAFSTSQCCNFCDSDAKRLTELRSWIASQKQQQPLPAASVTSNTALLPRVQSSEPTNTLLSEIKKEGNYVLHCKVLDVHILSDEMHIFTITDGTLFIYCFHLDEDERHATREVRIIIMHPSPEVKEIQTGDLVELTNVTVQVIVPPDSSLCNWPYLSFKMNGNNCPVKIFKGHEPEVQQLRRRLHEESLNGQQPPTDPVNQLMTETVCERPCQPNCNNHVGVPNTVTQTSVQNDSQHAEMTPVQQYLVSSGGEICLQYEGEQCSPPLISHAEEEINCQALQKSAVEQGVTNVQYIHLREQSVFTGIVKQKRNKRDSALLSRENMQHDFLAGNTVSENCIQEMAEEIETYAGFSDGVTRGSSARYCTSTHPIGNQNTNPVCNMGCLEDAKMDEVESVASEIVPASELDSLDSPGKFSALTQAHLRDSGLSNNHEVEPVIFMDVSFDASPVDTNSNASVPRTVQRSCVCAKCKRCGISGGCAEEDGGSSCATVVECTHEGEDEDTECHSAELHSGTVGCKQKFASGIHTAVQQIPTDISYIKRKGLQNGEQVYLLKAWVKDIEPLINNGSEMNILSGYCDSCNSTQSYEALKIRQKNHLLCQYCFQKGQKIPVVLGYLLWLHLIDEHDDELIVTVTADHGVELLGCTVNAYLYDSMANRRVVKILTDLIAKSKNVLPQNRGPMLKLLVTPVNTSVGTEYIVHSTYLYTTQNSEEQRNS